MLRPLLPFALSVAFHLSCLAPSETLAQNTAPPNGVRATNNQVADSDHDNDLSGQTDLANTLDSRVATFKIGSAISLSGPMAAFGDRCQKAYSMAMEDLRSKTVESGFKLELVIEDSPSNLPRSAISALNRLDYRNDLIAVLGFFAPEEVDAVTPLVSKKGLGLMSFCRGAANPKYSRFFWPAPAYEGAAAALHLRKSFKRVAIIGDDSNWNEQLIRGFEAEFKKLDGDIVFSEQLSADTKMVSSSLLKMAKQEPEALFIPSFYLFPLITKEIHNLKLKLPLFSVELEDSIIQLASPYGDDVLHIRPSTKSDFAKRFKDQFGIPADLPASYCYDQIAAVHQILSSLPENQRTRQSFADALLKLDNFSGVSGELVFKATGTETPLEWVRAGGS